MSSFENIVNQSKIKPKEVKPDKLSISDNQIIDQKPFSFNKQSFLSHDIKVIIVLNDQNGTKIDVSNYTLSLSIKKSFEKLFKPIYKINLNLPFQIYRKIHIFKDFKINLVIKSNKFATSQTLQELNPDVLSSEFITAVDTTLIPFNYTPYTDKELDKMDKNGLFEWSDARLPINLELFDYRHIKTGYTILSRNYRNQTLQNVIMDIINTNKDKALKYINNLVICQPDFINPIANITIPPMNLRESLEYLQNNYNIYKRKAIFYIDNDTFYIFKRGYSPILKDIGNNVVHVISGNESSVTGDNDHNEIAGLFDKLSKDTAKVYITPHKVKINNKYSTALSNLSDKVIVKSDSDVSGLRSSCIGVKDNSSLFTSMKNNKIVINDSYTGKEKFMVDNSSGPATMNLMVDEAQANSIDVNILIDDANLSYFNPTTIINLHIGVGSNEYNGKYYIREMIMAYKYDPIDENKLSSVLSLRLGRKFNDDGSVA